MKNDFGDLPLGKEPERIQRMFGDIAPTYDFLNHALSLSIDKLWRRRAAREVLRTGDRLVVDLACGTGDLAIELRRQAAREAGIVGIDFTAPMLALAAKKSRGAGISWVRGDALRLPLPDASVDAITIGFGLRNLHGVDAGLREMRRVLRPGGRLAVLELTTPSNALMRFGYRLYFVHVLPLIGRLVSRSDAYEYLCRSVMLWPDRARLACMIEAAGFGACRHDGLTFGIAALHIASVPKRDP